MTVASAVSRISYNGNGSTTAFAVPYYFLENSHLQVILTTGGVSTVQTITTNYTITGAGNPAGGTVNMLVAPASGTQLTIVRDVPATQETDYTANDPFPAESHERALDKLTMLVQENDARAIRSIRAPITDPDSVNMELPPASERADKLIQFDTNGDVDVVSTTQFIAGLAGAVIGANYITNNATGDGVTVAYTLSSAPGAKGNLQIYIDGVYQNKATFSLAGTTVTFTEAPPLNASVEFIIGYSIGSTSGDATGIDFTQQGTGAVSRTVANKLYEFVSVKDFGAVGDGVTDDTAAIQAAIDAANNVFVPSGLYKLNSSVVLKTNTQLRGAGRKDSLSFDGGTLFLPAAGVQSFVTAGVTNPLLGANNIYLVDFAISNNFTGTKYDIELANAHSCTVENVYIGSGNTTVTDCAGIYFSAKTGYTGSLFVNTVKSCRLSAASVKFETTDNYLLDSEIWGNNRSFAVHILKSSINIDSCQIVGGSAKGGVYVEDTINGFDIELVKISNTYFDGSYASVDSGIGINAVDMTRSSIVGCGFWRQTKEGIVLDNCKTVTIGNCIFVNNNRADDSKDDIYMDGCAACVATGNVFQRTTNHTNKGAALKTVNSANENNIFVANSRYFTSFYASNSLSNLDEVIFSQGMPIAGMSNVQATPTTTFAGPVGTPVPLSLGTEIEDTLNEFNGTSFIAKKSGVYTINLIVKYTSVLANTRFTCSMFLNNVNNLNLYDKIVDSAGDTVISGNATIKLNLGDKIDFYISQGAAADIVAGAANTRLNIFRLN